MKIYLQVLAETINQDKDLELRSDSNNLNMSFPLPPKIILHSPSWAHWEKLIENIEFEIYSFTSIITYHPFNLYAGGLSMV